MAELDTRIPLGVRPVDVATPLMAAAQLKQAQQQGRMVDLQFRQQALGFEARGLVPYVNHPEFGQRWAGAVDRLAQQGVLDPQTAQQWRSSPSPLMLQQIISQTENPELAFRRQESQRLQGNVEREFGLKERTAKQAEVKVVKDAQGNETLVRIEPGGQSSVIRPEGLTPTVTNPYAAGGKLNESQGKAATYSDRMAKSHKIITELENINEGVTGFAGGTLSNMAPVWFGSTLATPSRQKVVQAQRDFVNAVLRRESGAVINPSEFDNAAKQYFPQPGDSPEVIAQKRENRITALKGIMREAGPGYAAPEIYKNDQSLPRLGRNDKAKFDALPSGAEFIDPDGVKRKKP